MSIYDEIGRAAIAAGLSDTLGVPEAAALSAAYWVGTYPDMDGAVGWSQLAIADRPSGYDAVALLHERSNTLVIINRGAEGSFFGDDWAAGFSAAVGEPVAPLSECVEFAAEAWTLSAGQPDIFVTGQSWGGALAEAQVMLVRQALRKPNLGVTGIAFASAGFKKTIQAVAANMSLPWKNEYADDIEHYIRFWDPINVTRSNGWWGRVNIVGSIYKERMQDLPPGQRGPRRKTALAISDLNHNRAYYFKYPDLPASQHVLIDLKNVETIVDRPNP